MSLLKRDIHFRSVFSFLKQYPVKMYVHSKKDPLKTILTHFVQCNMQRWKLMSVFQKGFHVAPWSPTHNKFKELIKSNLRLYKTFASIYNIDTTRIFVNLQIDLIVKRNESRCKSKCTFIGTLAPFWFVLFILLDSTEMQQKPSIKI